VHPASAAGGEEEFAGLRASLVTHAARKTFTPCAPLAEFSFWIHSKRPLELWSFDRASAWLIKLPTDAAHSRRGHFRDKFSSRGGDRGKIASRRYPLGMRKVSGGRWETRDQLGWTGRSIQSNKIYWTRAFGIAPRADGTSLPLIMTFKYLRC